MAIQSLLARSHGVQKQVELRYKGIDYKWIVLLITTIEMFMVSVNGSIILISLPAIFYGININPLTSFQYLIWILMGYNLVTATLLLSFGRLSDMYGRVRLYNVGFAIFTPGSILLYLTPDTREAGAIEIIVFRLVQAVGASNLIGPMSVISPTGALFVAFVGYNPVNTNLNAVPQSVIDTISPETIKVLTDTAWFPTTLTQAFILRSVKPLSL